MHSGHSFYTNIVDATGEEGASLEAHVLLPIKTFAYGVPPHTFTDYFQMSKNLACDCCDNFCQVMIKIYGEEYFRLPDCEDLKNITRLHKEVHSVNGML